MKSRYIFSFLRRLSTAIKSKGLIKSVLITMNYIANMPVSNITLLYLRAFKPSRHFLFRNKKYNYFYHGYNNTFSNERAIEIPIIYSIVKDYNNRNILEVGNVLSHYYDTNYDVVDKYESRDNIISADIVDYVPKRKYDLIISISTLEHVGHDEAEKDPNKTYVAISRLKNMLNKDGIIAITVPMGHNPHLDEYIKTEKIQFKEAYLYKRISKDNQWEEVDPSLLKTGAFVYGNPYKSANHLLIGIIKKSDVS